MNYGFLIQKISDEQNLPHNTVKRTVDAMFREMKSAILAKDDLKIKGFGTFKNISTPAKKIKLPQGHTIDVPTRQRVQFLISTRLKKDINNV